MSECEDLLTDREELKILGYSLINHGLSVRLDRVGFLHSSLQRYGSKTDRQ